MNMNGVKLVPHKSIDAYADIPDVTICGEESYVYFHINPKHTNFVNRIIEGYEYLGVMTTLDPNGRCMLRCTPSTRPVAIDLLTSLSDYVTLES